jgi:phosphonate transport system substrate-binding protein
MRKIIVAGLILPLGFVLASAHGQEVPKKSVLTMGRATDKVVKQGKRIEPIITYLASRLKDMGIERGEVVLAGDNKVETLIELLKEEKLDIVLETPFIVSTLKPKANLTLILLCWKGGVPEYNSFIFVRGDSGISRLEDLKGKIITFEDPGSTSAYFLPKFSMKAKGLDLVELPSFDSPIPKDKIGYLFAGSELNISSWVFYNKVAAGALSNLDWATSEENPEAYREEFEIIYETQKVPRMLVVVREALNEKLVARIKEELLKMDKSEEGREALKASKYSKFTELPGGAEGILGPIEDLLDASGEEIR